MTVIVGLVSDNKVYIGADSAIECNGTQRISVEPKVFIRHGMLFGSTGDMRTPQLIQHVMTLREKNYLETTYQYMHNVFIVALRECLYKNGAIERLNGKDRMYSTLMVGYEGSLFTVYNDFAVVESVPGYDAIGSGEQFALGSLFTTSNKAEVLQDGAKMQYNPTTRVMLALEAAAINNSFVTPPYKVLNI